MAKILFTCLVVALGAAVAHAAISADEVTSLPGWSGDLPSKQYSGYLTVDETMGRRLHYWAQYSLGDPSKDPVVFWFNGGPGCSSMDGAMYESGMFHVMEDNHSELYYNNHTWSQFATMVYLEAPAGVGFSYAVSPLPSTNDTQTAEDNFHALVKFFEGFPEFADNELFIAGESYAGIYVPTLAQRVLKGNAAGESKLNLIGIAVGNGCTGTEIGVCGNTGNQIRIDFLHARGLFSTRLYNEIQNTCKDVNNPGKECATLLQEMSNSIGDINIYDIYTPCISGGFDAGFSPYARGMTKASGHPALQGNNLGASVDANGLVGGPDGCIDAIAAGSWLNTEAVQRALHVYEAKPYWKQWQVCSNVNYFPNVANEPRDVYPGLVAAKLRIMIFNGDVDSCVPLPDNEGWTRNMGYPVKTPWHPWSIDHQVAGYATEYTTPSGGVFNFVTVHDSGHMVPQYQPERAAVMISHFLNNQPL